MTGRLVGVGVGPGDPQLVTVQAVRTLQAADVVFVPVADSGELGRAERTVRAYVERPLRRLVFAMDRVEDRPASWDAAGRQVADALSGLTGEAAVAFATIGDPNIYSTFSYLAQTVRGLLPDIVVETVPGITAMQALAARSGTVLVEGRESLVLLPLAADTERLAEALRGHDTVVAYKGGRRLPELLDEVAAAGRLDTAVFGAGLGLPEEEIRPAATLDPTARAAYLSTVLIPPHRGDRGAAL